jgi:hypothetical protein
METMVLMNPDAVEDQDWVGGPQQMSISVRRWKKRLSSNVWDVLVLTKIAMLALKHWTCH